MFKRTFLRSERQRSAIKVHSGADSFAFPDFSDVFERSALPADVGGTLTSGADGHCCRGVELPAVSDAEAMWGLYQGLLSPRLKAQVAERVQQLSSTIASTNLTVPLSVEATAFQPNEFESAIARHRGSPKSFACYLCRDSTACADEARLVQQHLEEMLGASVFLGK